MATQGDAVIREFNRYREILAIYPGLVCTGWAVLNHKSGTLLDCGIAQPFARVNETQTIAELRQKLLRIWEDRVGFSTNPKILAVEMPQCPDVIQNPQTSDLVPVSIMSGLIWASFNAEKVFLPKPASWKRLIPMEAVNEKIAFRLNLVGKKALAEGLHVVPRYLRHNVYNAVGIGQWAYRQTQKVDA
jgi:hypothetical protein